MNGEYAALAARVRASLADVDRVVARAELLSRRAQESGDDGFWDGVALNLHGFYAGLEQVFIDIARTIERAVPPGTSWQRLLVLQLSAEVARVRPAVLSSATRQCLDEYRGFRHIVRNVYTFNLRLPRRRDRRSQRLRRLPRKCGPGRRARRRLAGLIDSCHSQFGPLCYGLTEKPAWKHPASAEAMKGGGSCRRRTFVLQCRYGHEQDPLVHLRIAVAGGSV